MIFKNILGNTSETRNHSKIVVSAEVHMGPNDYHFNPDVTPKKTLKELKTRTELFSENAGKFVDLQNKHHASQMGDDPDTVTSPHTPECVYVQVTDETNVGDNIIIRNNNDNSIVQDFQLEQGDPIAIASSTPMKKIKFAASEYPSMSDNIQTQNYNNLTQDIITKLNALDETSLVEIQEWIANRTTIQSCSGDLVGNSNGNVDKILMRNFADFLPVGTLNQCSTDSQSNNEAGSEDKKTIMKGSDAEEIFNIPQSMYAYIYNKESDDVVLVKLVPEDDDLSTYRRVDNSQKEVVVSNTDQFRTTKLSALQKPNNIKVARPCEMSKNKCHKLCKKIPKRMRRVTAKWSKARNRHLHSRFVKQEMWDLRKKWSKIESNVGNLNGHFPEKKSVKNGGSCGKRKISMVHDEDPEYKPRNFIANFTGNN